MIICKHQKIAIGGENDMSQILMKLCRLCSCQMINKSAGVSLIRHFVSMATKIFYFSLIWWFIKVKIAIFDTSCNENIFQLTLSIPIYIMKYPADFYLRTNFICFIMLWLSSSDLDLLHSMESF